jgi:hypothetical protein
VMDTLGIAYVERWQQTEQKTFRWARGGSTVLPPIAGYTTAFVIESTDVDSLILDGRSCALHYETETASLRLLQDGELLIRIPLQGAITYALEHGPRPPAPGPPSDRMVIRVVNDRVAALLAVRSLAGHEEPEGPVIDSFSATVFVRF